jgi:hypothetical protein
MIKNSEKNYIYNFSDKLSKQKVCYRYFLVIINKNITRDGNDCYGYFIFIRIIVIFMYIILWNQ